MSRSRRLTAGLAAVLLGLLSVLVGPIAPAAATGQEVPGQFIAKIYTESVGRLPYQSEWQRAADRFSEGGCTVQTLAEVGQQVYGSADFAELGYDNVSKLTTLYRGVLNTEPDTGELATLQSDLEHGEPWSTVVARFFVGEEFTALAPKICSGAIDASATSYAFAGRAASALPSGSAGFSGSQDELQTILDEASPGSTVQLGQRALITVTKPLTVPEGVTLTTTGSPDTEHYAQMGRLVRGGDFDAPMVDVADGAKLTGVWVDGARNSPGNSSADRHNVRVLGGTDTAVVGNKISNTAGSISVQVLGQASGHRCSGVRVEDNMITAYSNDHYLTRQLPDGSTAGTWSDGISIDCADTSVRGNEIVDTGGVAIVAHRGTAQPNDDVAQQSEITDNNILSAGVAMYAGIVVDPRFFVAGEGDGETYSFTGTKINKNRLWTGPTTHFVIGISAGTRPWYAGTAMTGSNTGEGVTISGNETGSVGARVRTGIAISGIQDVRLDQEPADWRQDGVPGKQGNPCPAVDTAVSESAGTGSVETDDNYTDVDFDGCMAT